jgi:MinD superfamily P-loop ATPase
VIVAIASGKGGTGKTTVATNLALSLASEQGERADTASAGPLFLDCDVEEPNAALFLKPTIEERHEVGQMIPQVDPDACTYCGRCAEVCQYHAIAVVTEKVLVFPELCHGCGSCTLNCRPGAIHEVLHRMGTIERGWAGGIAFAQGTMNVGEAMAVPIIRHLKQWAIPADAVTVLRENLDGRPILLDAPPGTACPVVETMRDADVVLMVTEPTPFGLHDLRLAIDVARDELSLPVAVVVNRDGVGDRGVDEYCAAEGIPILMRIPLDRRIAEAYSEGVPMIEAIPTYRQHFLDLWETLRQINVQSSVQDGSHAVVIDRSRQGRRT